MVRGICVALACLLAPAASAFAAPQIAGRTVVEADAAAFVDVVLPVPLRPFGDRARRPAITVQQGGTATLLTLRAIDGVDESGWRDSYEYARLVHDGEEIIGTSGSFTCECPDEPVLAAGRYRLYLHSDAPARVTIALPGLAGERALRLLRPVALDGGALRDFASETPFTRVLGRWGSLGASRGVMHMIAAFETAAAPTVDRLEICFLDGDREAEGDGAFQPGCSESSDPLHDVIPLGGGGTGVWLSAHNFPAGRYGLGANLTHAGETVPGDGFAVWAGYDDGAPVLEEGAPPAPAPVPPPAPAAPAADPSGRLALATPAARVRRGRTALRLHCTGGPCTGSVALAGGRTATVAVPAGRSAVVRVAVPAAVRRALRKRRSVRSSVVVRSNAASGGVAQRVPVRLRR